MNFLKNKLTALILVVVLIGLLGGCDSFDNSKCLTTVQKKYPNARIYALPDHDYRYIVIDSTEVRYLAVKGSWDEISRDILIDRRK